MRNKPFHLLLFAVIFCVLMNGCSPTVNNHPKQHKEINQTSSTNTSNNSTQLEQKIEIVAAESFYGEVAEAVGGKWVHVTSIIHDPIANPHDFEPTLEVAKLISNANLIVYNGVGYDNWIDKLLNASSNEKRTNVINVATDIMGIKDGENEHVWYNPNTMPKLANELANQLTILNPENAEFYTHNANQYIASLKPLNQLIGDIKQSKQLLVDTSEPVFDYMLEELNFKVNNAKFELAIDEGADPAPKDLARLQEDIKDKKIVFFVNNIQSDSPTVHNVVTLAQQNDIPIIEVTETNPAGENYLQWMMSQLQQIQTALQNQHKEG